MKVPFITRSFQIGTPHRARNESPSNPELPNSGQNFHPVSTNFVKFLHRAGPRSGTCFLVTPLHEQRSYPLGEAEWKLFLVRAKKVSRSPDASINEQDASAILLASHTRELAEKS